MQVLCDPPLSISGLLMKYIDLNPISSPLKSLPTGSYFYPTTENIDGLFPGHQGRLGEDVTV